jgi:hypothetical protein
MASAQVSHNVREKFKSRLHNSHFMIASDDVCHPGAAVAAPSGDFIPFA